MSNPWAVAILSGLIVTIVGGVVVVWFEYKCFVRDRSEHRPSSGDRSILELEPVAPQSWESAQQTAIGHFKRAIGKYNWISERVNVVSFSANKGRGYLEVEITPTDLLTQRLGIHTPYGRTPVIGMYALIIDRTGDILEMKPGRHGQ